MMSYELAGILITVIIQALYIAFKIGKFEEKLINLENKQDKYNNVIERTYELEKSEAVFTEQMKDTIHRVDDLEQFHKPQ